MILRKILNSNKVTNTMLTSTFLLLSSFLLLLFISIFTVKEENTRNTKFQGPAILKAWVCKCSGQAGRKEVEVGMAFHREILLILFSESQRQISFMKQHVCGLISMLILHYWLLNIVFTIPPTPKNIAVNLNAKMTDHPNEYTRPDRSTASHSMQMILLFYYKSGKK